MRSFFSLVGSLVLLTSLTAAVAQGEKTPDVASDKALEKASAPKSAASGSPSKSWSWDLLLAGRAIGLADFDGEGKPAFGVSTDELFEMNVRRVSAMFKARALEVLKFKVHLLSMPVVSPSALNVADLHMAVEPHPGPGGFRSFPLEKGARGISKRPSSKSASFDFSPSIVNLFPSQNWLFAGSRPCTPSVQPKIWVLSAARHAIS